MKNILVTGGAGFIGSHTVVELVNAGYIPIIIDNFTNSEKSVLDGIKNITGQQVTFYEGDYQDEKLLQKVLKDESIDGVIHFAANKAVGESVEEPLKYYQNNIAGLIALLKTMQKYSVKNLVFSSSCTVYGEPDSIPVTEQSPVKPAASPYGATKQMGEIIIRDITTAGKNLKSISLRYFNPIGAHPSAEIGELPRGVPANLVPFMTQAAAGLRDQLTVYGDNYPTADGSGVRDYIHVVDLAKAHIKALEYASDKSAGFYDVFNIGTGHGNSVLELIKTFEKVTGKKVPYTIGPKRAGDIAEIYADVTKTEKILGWKAEKSLDDCLEDAWRWQQKLTKTS